MPALLSRPAWLLGLVALLLFGSAGWAIEMTPAEAEFVRAHPVWRMAGASTPPFQWMDAKGNWRGIATDYRRIIERSLGVRLEPVPAPTWDASLEQLRRRECDVSLMTASTPARAEFLTFTQPLLVLPLAIITRRDSAAMTKIDDLTGRRVAVGRHWPIHEQLEREHRNLTLLPRDDVGGAISAVALGDADAYVGDLASATYAIERLGLRNLKVAGEPAYSFPFRVAVRTDWPEAVSLMDKAIATITPGEHGDIRRKWIRVEGDGWSLFEVLAIVLPVAIGAVLLILLLSNRRLQHEIVERRKTEAALRESEERWGFALDGSRDGVWDWNVKTNEVFFSKRFRTMLNFSESELPGRFEEWISRVHSEDIDTVLHEIQRHLRGDTRAYEVEHRVSAKGDTYRWILARGRVVSHDEGGAPVRMVGTHTDITERRRVEEELRNHRGKLEETVRLRTADLERAERRLRQITDTIPGAVYQFRRDPQGAYAFTFCSEGMEKMVGVSSEDAVADVNRVWAVIHPDDLTELIARAEHSAKTLTHYVQDLRICQPDGRRWWVQAESVPQAQRDGSIVWNGNIVDITDRKRLEEELALAKRLADSANQAKSAFLANMSHEIRTPMNAVLGFSQLLMRDPALNEVQRHYLDTINRSGEHLLALINDILEFSKIEAGRVQLHLTTFDLHALFDDIDRVFRLRAQGRGLRFAIEGGLTTPQYVLGDESRLRQIFLNLLGNAVKFTERGRVVLRVAAEPGEGSALWLRCEVEDTGPGITSEELPRLFREFEQMEAGRRTGTGTGLGLAISRQFARLMGGDLKVTSEVGVGTTFHLDVGLERSESALGQRPEHRRVLRLEPGQAPVRVLIADDVPENCELLERILQPAGFETRSVEDGETALAVFAAWHPHVALLDLRMSGLDGFELMRRIRQKPDGASVPLIAVTASAFEENRREVLAAGGSDFLGKPFRESDLFERIGRLTGLQYLYADPSAEGATSAAPDLTPAQVTAAIPRDLRKGLREAAVRADFDQMLALLEAAGQTSPGVAVELRALVERFEYQALIALLEAGTLPA